MTSTQSEVAKSKLALRAAEKSSHQAKWPTLAPNDSAIATVSSVEPVSTTTISSTWPRSEAKQRGRFAASSLTIKQAETVGRRAPKRSGWCFAISASASLGSVLVTPARMAPMDGWPSAARQAWKSAIAPSTSPRL
ncbi:hypothetical protein D3C72_1679340 [compost metagenome]